MIDSRNIAPGAQFAQQAVVLPISAGASATNVLQSGWRAPFAGKVESASVYAATLTDADDSVRVDVLKGSTSILAAAVDPVAADTGTVLPLAVTPTSFVAGDVLKARILTGAGDAMVGQVTLMVRPQLGPERAALPRGA